MSTIIYIDGSKIVAKDAKGDIIALGLAGKDDSLILQAAVDLGGLIVLRCNLNITAPVNISKNYVTIRGMSEADPSWYVDSAPITIKSRDNDIFYVSGCGFCLNGITFNDVYKCVIFSANPVEGQLRIATIERCTFTNLHDTPLTFDTKDGYLVGPIKIIDNHFYAVGGLPTTRGETIPSYIKFIGTAYEITDIIIERNDFNPGAIKYIDIDIDGGYIEFISFCSNYFEGTDLNTCKIHIDCNDGRVLFFCAIRDCKISGNMDVMHHHDAAGIVIHVRNNGSVEMNGIQNNFIFASDITMDIEDTGSISGLSFIGNQLALGDVRFEQKSAWWDAAICGILFIANHVVSNIYATKVHGFTFTNNSHRDITINIDTVLDVKIKDNTPDFHGARVMNILLKNTELYDIAGNIGGSIAL